MLTSAMKDHLDNFYRQHKGYALAHPVQASGLLVCVPNPAQSPSDFGVRRKGLIG